MKYSPHHRLVLATVAMLGASTPLFAEEGLLWKSVASVPAVVVPAYTGQVSPFPKVTASSGVSSDVVDTAAVAEQQRLRDKAYNYVEQMIRSGRAMRPDLRTVSVGGMVDGRLGTRVLINNQWVGVGAKVPVRRIRSLEAVDALKVLEEFDTTASAELTQSLGSAIASNPTELLVVQSITPKSLVLKDNAGKTYPVGFSVDSQY